MSHRYMLDTNMVSYALRGQGRVKERIVACPPSLLCVSAMTMAELSFGAARRKALRWQGAINEFSNEVAVLPFGEAEASVFGHLMAELERGGQSMETFDGLIAAHAIARGVALVTHDRGFQRVSRLELCDWY